MDAPRPAPPLLERDEHLQALHGALAGALAGRGSLALVAAEAGGGKSALVRAFCAALPGRLEALTGACDPLYTPRPLGPFADVAVGTGGVLAAVVESGGRPYEVLRALEPLLARRRVLVVEDVHWADEASLDVLRLLGRRIEGVPALLVVTYRDDELGAAHPLTALLGSLASEPEVQRLRLPPLSVAAVAALAAEQALDARELHARTGGNPFYVTEVLAAGGGLPASVREAVLARASRLSLHARHLLDAVAVVPGRADLALLDLVAPEELGAVEECTAAGILREEGAGLAFRHELARLAVESSVPPARRRALHAALLRALSDLSPSDHARLAHHAEAAGDRAAVLVHAPAAAERAAALAAHREAAAQWGRTLRFAEGLDDAELLGLLERRAHECYLTGQTEEALEARQRATAIARALAEVEREGEQLCWISRLHWYAGRREEADRTAEAAVELLERWPPGPALARAYATMASRRQVALDLEGTATWARRAEALARALDETEILARTLVVRGSAESFAGITSDRLAEGLRLALEHDLEDVAGTAFGNTAVYAIRRRDWKAAERALREGLRYCTERDLDSDRLYLVAWRGVASLHRARWDEAAADARAVLADPGAIRVVRATALITLGVLRARRGDPGVSEPLDEALAIGREAADLPKLAPLALASAEAAFLAGDRAQAREELACFVPASLADRWIAGEVAIWLRRLEAEET